MNAIGAAVSALHPGCGTQGLTHVLYRSSIRLPAFIMSMVHIHDQTVDCDIPSLTRGSRVCPLSYTHLNPSINHVASQHHVGVQSGVTAEEVRHPHVAPESE